MNFSRGVLVGATVLLLLGAAGAATWWRLRPAEDAETSAGDGEEAAVEVESANTQFASDVPTPVEGAEVVEDTLWITVNAGGIAEAARRARVTSQVEGIIEVIPVRENSSVASEGLLVQIDTTELALSVAEARAGLAEAQAQYESTILFDDRVEDPEVRRKREVVARSSSGLNQAEVAVRTAEVQLERATIRSPWGARVADLDVVEGQFVAAGTELLTLVDLDPIRVEASVTDVGIAMLEEGRRARVVFAAFPGEEFNGVIESINPVVDPESRIGRVTVFLPNPDGRIKPGMFADVTLEARAYPDRIMVPREAVLERGVARDRKMVFLYAEEGGRGLAKWQYVNTGVENEEWVELLPADDGTVLTAGQTVLVEGHQFLAHDTQVRLVENVVAAGGRPTR